MTLGIPANTTETLLILASNGEFGRPWNRTFTASMERSSDPTLAITSPMRNTFEEGNIAFRADVAGIDPDGVAISWMYDLPHGAPFTFGSSESGQVLDHILCDGLYTVKARIIYGDGAGLKDTKNITVSDLGATNPPAQCAPGVTIVEPASGSTYPLGQTFHSGLPSVIVMGRQVCATRSSGVQVGRLDRFIGQGQTANFQGGWSTSVIHASYGAANDNVSISVVPTISAPPTATITSPEAGSRFWFSDSAYIGWNTITFTCRGFTSGGAPLNGSSLTWSTRRSGSGRWVDHGTGESVTINFYWSSFNWQVYEVRLWYETLRACLVYISLK